MTQSTPDQPAPELGSESTGQSAEQSWQGRSWLRGTAAVAVVLAVIAAAAYGVTRDSTNDKAAASGNRQSASPTDPAISSPAATARATNKATQGQTPATAPGAAGSSAKSNVSTGGTKATKKKKKAKKLKATATVQDRQVAREDAQAEAGSADHPLPPGVWRVGSVGTYLVGKGIVPGTYESAAPSIGKCHWARLKDLTDAPRDIIAKRSTAGSSVVTIRASDRFFRTSNCQNWHKIG